MTQADRNIIARYSRGFFYSLTIVLGIALALGELDSGRVANFSRFSFLVSGVFAIELFTSWVSRRSNEQTTIPQGDRLGRYTALLHHLIIPIGGYAAVVGFTYYNRQPSLRGPILAIALLMFTVLFVNIRSYYDNVGKLEHYTHYIYDVIKFLIFFGISNVFLNLAVLTSNTMLPILGITILSFILMSLVLMRNRKLEMFGIMMSAGFSFILSIILLVFTIFGELNPLELTILSVLAFYLGSAAIHHQMKRDLTVSIVIEYVAVLAIALAVLYGLS